MKINSYEKCYKSLNKNVSKTIETNNVMQENQSFGMSWFDNLKIHSKETKELKSYVKEKLEANNVRSKNKYLNSIVNNINQCPQNKEVFEILTKKKNRFTIKDINNTLEIFNHGKKNIYIYEYYGANRTTKRVPIEEHNFAKNLLNTLLYETQLKKNSLEPSVIFRFIEKADNTKEQSINKLLSKNLRPEKFEWEDIPTITNSVTASNKKYLDKFLYVKERKNCQMSANDISDLLNAVNPKNLKYINRLLFIKNRSFDNQIKGCHIAGFIKAINENNKIFTESILTTLENHNTNINGSGLISIMNEINPKNNDIILDGLKNNLNYPEINFALKFKEAYKDLKSAKSIADLTSEAKNVLLKSMVSFRYNFSFSNLQKNIPILPKDKTEHNLLVSKLLKSSNLKTKKISKNNIKQFYEAINNLEIILPKTNISKIKSLNLEFSKADFIKQANFMIENSKNKDELFKYFNFTIKDEKLIGYPSNNENKFVPEAIKKEVELLRPLVVDFTDKNKFILNNNYKTLEKELNKIIKVFPEFLTTVNKAQYGSSHSSTLDLHILNVFKNAIEDPEYKKLNSLDKKILKTVILLHDIAKNEKGTNSDSMHPLKSANDASLILNNLNMPEIQKERICNLIKHHHWAQKINSNNNKSESLNTAFAFRHSGDLQIMKIFARADLKSVSSEFYEHYKNNLSSKRVNDLENNIEKIHQTGVWLPQTRVPKASKMNIKSVKLGNEDKTTQNKVIFINKNPDLNTLGFDEGATAENFTSFVHVSKKIDSINALSNESINAILSTSFISKNSCKTFNSQKFGVLIDADQSNIIAAQDTNILSGYHKDIEDEIENLFNGSLKSRNHFSGYIKNKLGLTKEEYSKLYKNLSRCTSLNQISNKKLSSAIKDYIKILLKTKYYNEITILAPKIKAVFSKEKDPNKIPYVYRKFAQDNDLAIMIF